MSYRIGLVVAMCLAAPSALASEPDTDEDPKAAKETGALPVSKQSTGTTGVPTSRHQRAAGSVSILAGLGDAGDNAPFDSSLFLRSGNLEISEWIFAEVLAESVLMQIPFATAQYGTPATVLLKKHRVNSLGARLNFVAPWGFFFNLGIRYLDPSGGVGPLAPGFAGEANVDYVRKLWEGWALGLFGSLSLTAIKDSSQFDSTSAQPVWSRREAVNEYRGLVGASVDISKGTAPATRIGFYATYWKNFWDTEIREPSVARDVSGFHVEGGVMLGGAFDNGFTGTVTIGARRPYGGGRGAEDVQDTQWFIAISPAVTTPLAPESATKVKK